MTTNIATYITCVSHSHTDRYTYIRHWTSHPPHPILSPLLSPTLRGVYQVYVYTHTRTHTHRRPSYSHPLFRGAGTLCLFVFARRHDTYSSSHQPHNGTVSESYSCNIRTSNDCMYVRMYLSVIKLDASSFSEFSNRKQKSLN